jgi:hypothetical protein
MPTGVRSGYEPPGVGATVLLGNGEPCRKCIARLAVTRELRCARASPRGKALSLWPLAAPSHCRLSRRPPPRRCDGQCRRIARRTLGPRGLFGHYFIGGVGDFGSTGRRCRVRTGRLTSSSPDTEWRFLSTAAIGMGVPIMGACRGAIASIGPRRWSATGCAIGAKTMSSSRKAGFLCASGSTRILRKLSRGSRRR